MQNVNSDNWFKRFLRFLIGGFIRKVINHFLFDIGSFMGLLVLLWTFYCGIGDRIFPRTEADLVNPGNVIYPLAWLEALQNFDFLIIFFPFLFFTVAVLVHRFWDRWYLLIPTILLSGVFDYIVALISSKNIYDYRESTDEFYSGTWSPIFGGDDYLGHVLIVMVCGIGGSVALGALYHVLHDLIKDPIKVSINNEVSINNTDIEESDIDNIEESDIDTGV